ncbi:MAG: Si-specific NAD(P)(+) transhydrogenase [Gammaproteobacteria bacterium]|nr:Si-specific NAD(P)(+) transhydrogenase [Gammaproteobacteria bacterium]
MNPHYDLIVIGSGPAGMRGAIQAAELGKKVLLVERTQIVGGATVHTSTIPSKTFRESVLFLTGWQRRGIYGRGYKAKNRITIDDLRQRLNTTLKKEIDIIQRELRRQNVEIVYGHARFKDEHTITVEEHRGNFSEYQADKMLIAVGTKTSRPDTLPFDGDTVIDSDEIIHLNRIPEKLLVIGGGVIGLEYATIYGALDVEVTIIESSDRILGFVDEEIVDQLIHDLSANKINLSLKEELINVEKRDNGKLLCHLKGGKNIRVDTVLYAGGRQAVTDQLSLGQVGVATDNLGCIPVNDNYQTSQANIYAAGDVTGFPGMTSTSMAQGRHAACHAFGIAVEDRPELFPYGIFSLPEISMVGLTEKQCNTRGIEFVTGRARFRDTARGKITGSHDGMLKMLFSVETQKLLGVHIIGESATEMVHTGQAVIALGGTLDYFMRTAFNYPTLAEAYKIAALDACSRMKT